MSGQLDELEIRELESKEADERADKADKKEEKEELLKEIGRLKIENKKINRQLTAANNLLEKLKNTAIAHENLSAVLSAEKSRQEKYLQVIVENSPNEILLLDRTMRFILSTRSFLDLTGIPTIGLLQNKTFREVFSARMDAACLEHMEGLFTKALRGNEIQVSDEKLDIGGAGNSRNYLVSVVPFSYSDGVSDGILVIFNDLTDIVRARDNARAASEAKSNFLATMSHEIRTPMNAIIGMSNMLEKTELDEHQQFLSQNIKNSSMALLSLVNDILDFSKIEAGKFELVVSYFNVRVMLRRLESVFDVLFTQKGLGFHVNVSADFPGVVLGDENRLKQILTNLLSNALKYTREGYVTLKAFCPGGDGDSLRFEVEDTGGGIKESDLKKLFSPFEQLDKVLNRNVVGTGLGLPITRRLCELMNGGIEVSSTYGKGSVFSVSLPLIRGEISDLRDSEAEVVSFTAPGARALVVDDIEMNLIVAEAMLREYGMEIMLATHGQQAIRLALENKFDIIFMDHMMPDMDGIETTRTLRKAGGYLQDVPIIALTANATVEAQNMFIENGFNEFVAKPIDPILLNRCLQRWLDRGVIVTPSA